MDAAGPTPILHHYDFSHYAEKVRLVLGLKGLAWQSVIIPAWAPKPDYTPLTAGYRRTPALQCGADVYCDTHLIVDVLDALAPRPSLYPGPDPARGRALVAALTHWAETALCRPLALYITGLHQAQFPDAFHADRARLHGKPPPSRAQVEAAARTYLPQVLPQLARLDALLGTGDYVFGAAPCLADFALYAAPWFLVTIGGEAALPVELRRTRAWMARIAAIGHGPSTTLSAAAALATAHAAAPSLCASAAPDPYTDLAPGEVVEVRPLDADAPARGRLVAADATRIVLACEDPRSGTVHVHFPRLGYRLRRAPDTRAGGRARR